MSPLFLPNASVTGIGSLPLTDVQVAIRLVAQLCPEVPFWPQLPRLSEHEYMITQTLGPRTDFLTAAGYGYRVKPGQLNALLQELHTCIARLDERYAAGFFAFEQAVAAGLFKGARAVKGQLVGPITLACTLFVEERALLLKQEHLAALGNYVARLALWQARRLQLANLPVICFLDEPCLALLNHVPFQSMAEYAVQVLHDVVTSLQGAGVIVGIHCCAGLTSFDIIGRAAPDIISFDAYQDLELFCADQDAQAFLKAGGLVAFGLVPTSHNLSSPDPSLLFARWLLACKDVIDLSLLASHTMITATCGLGLLSPSQTESSFRSAQHIADLIQKITDPSQKSPPFLT